MMNAPPFVITIFFGCCHNTHEEIRKTSLFEEVIHQYEVVQPCRQKKKAALYLFRHLSVKFFDQDSLFLEGKRIHNLWRTQDPEKVYGDDILAWLWTVRHNFTYIGYEFSTPKNIASIALLACNDGNQIIAGDEYELMVWDKDWRSLGKQTAHKPWLTFHDVPSNGLYWLKNLSGGAEELPFIMNEEGEQVWPGLDKPSDYRCEIKAIEKPLID